MWLALRKQYYAMELLDCLSSLKCDHLFGFTMCWGSWASLRLHSWWPQVEWVKLKTLAKEFAAAMIEMLADQRDK